MLATYASIKCRAVICASRSFARQIRVRFWALASKSQRLFVQRINAQRPTVLSVIVASIGKLRPLGPGSPPPRLAMQRSAPARSIETPEGP